MKNFTLACIATAMIAGSVFAQAPKFVVMEHFTQASCGPCASQNPGFETNILTPNPDKVHHIAFHTSWPGVDPMYNANTAMPDARVIYYNVTGVPSIIMNGNQKTGQPGAFSQADVDNQFSESSPIKVSVNDVAVGINHTVTVTVLTVGVVPSGSYVMRLCVVENPIDYTSAPGNNGETHFPNVARLMLPSDAGDPIASFPAIGNTATFTYTYAEDPSWVASNIKAIAYVQNNTTKEVIQSGAMGDPIINFTLGNAGVEIMHGVTSTVSSFAMTSMNSGTASEDFIYTLTTGMPVGWTAGFTVNSTPYTTTATVTTAAAALNNISINITPDATPFVGWATLTVTSVQNPTSPALTKTVYVISNVTDLVMNCTGGIGDGVTVGNASNWDTTYTNAMVYANEPGWAKTTDRVVEMAIRDNAFAGVRNIYYNVGWTFPSLTDELVLRLTSFLNAGGCLFLSGQDIAWETWDTANSPYFTANTQAFFTGYFGCNFSADGGTSSTTLTAVASDVVFGTVPNSNITNFYGGSYYFPDELTPANGGAAIFKYNGGTKTAGTRKTNGTWKVVYIGTGMEMLGNITAKNEIMKWSHDWFYGLVSTPEFDNAMLQLSAGQNYPNPAGNSTMVPVSNVEKNMTLEVLDVQGRVVSTQPVMTGAATVEINTVNLEAGMYFYRLTDGTTFTEMNRMEVIH